MLSDVADTLAPGQTVPMAHMSLDPVDDEMFARGEVGVGKGESSRGDEWPKSSIAKRVRTLPRPRSPSILQSSLYLHLDRAVVKGKRKCTHVYTSRKRSKKHASASAVKLHGTRCDVRGAPPGCSTDVATSPMKFHC